jgi:hypothetical protein
MNIGIVVQAGCDIANVLRLLCPEFREHGPEKALVFGIVFGLGFVDDDLAFHRGLRG